MGTMDDDDSWVSRVGKPLEDLVPPAANKGDPLPPESMRLREELIRKHEEKMRMKAMGISEPDALDDGLTVAQALAQAHAQTQAHAQAQILVRLPLSVEDEARVDALLNERRQLRPSETRTLPLYEHILTRALLLPAVERLRLISLLANSLVAGYESASGDGGQ